LFFVVHPDFYLPSDKFEAKYFPEVTIAVSVFHEEAIKMEFAIANAANAEGERIYQEMLAETVMALRVFYNYLDKDTIESKHGLLKRARLSLSPALIPQQPTSPSPKTQPLATSRGSRST